MNYMLLVYAPERTAEQEGPSLERCNAASEELRREGKWLDGAILRDTDCSTCVRVRQGQRLVTDGPFVETREQLAGYMIVDVENLDEAIAVAARHPVAAFYTVEIRPFFQRPFSLDPLAGIPQ